MIDLAGDDELDLSDFGITDSIAAITDEDDAEVPEAEAEPEKKTKAAEDSGVADVADDLGLDEDELLAQLEEMNNDFDMSALDNLGEFGELSEEEIKKNE